MEAFASNNTTALHYSADVFIDALKDMDALLNTDSRFMVGPWINGAKSWGETDAERALYEFNARDIITLWGPDMNVVDYAAKQWGGLVADYYVPRWKMFFNELAQCLAAGRKFDGSRFRKTFVQWLGDPFRKSRKPYPTHPNEDTMVVVERIYKKWRSYLTKETMNYIDSHAVNG